MLVTATEFKNGVGKYLSLVDNEDVYITKNGKNIAKLSSSKQNKVDIMKSLFGVIPDDGTTLKEIKGERLARYETVD